MPRKAQLVDPNLLVRFRTGEPPELARKRCAQRGAPFADACRAASAVDLKHPMASFDRDLDQFKVVQRIEPKA